MAISMAGNGGGVFCNGSSVNSGSSKPLESFFLSGSSSNFLGSNSMVSFEDMCGGRKRSERPLFCTYNQEENEGDDHDHDEYLQQPEKKRRLSNEQVQFLEKSFETENKLEPERKVQLAKELGLQTRQVAIWFQNRRARWKTKQMEKDFNKLQANYNSLKSDYENLLEEKEKLKAEVYHLTDKLQQNNQPNFEPCNEPDQQKTIQQEPNLESASETEDLSISGYHKQEDPSSGKSDVIDSDSSLYMEPGHCSSYAFEADHSDISQDDEDYFNRTLLPSSYILPKIEDVDPPANSSHFAFPEDDQGSLFWTYWDVNLKMPSSLHM